MGFVEIKQEMVDGRLFRDPDPFFEWAKSRYLTIKGDAQISAKSFAFRLLDYVAAASSEEIEHPDEVFTRIISHAKMDGIEPWPNVVGLRLQASTCLAEFIERE